MAPQLALGQPADVRSDLWSDALLLAERALAFPRRDVAGPARGAPGFVSRAAEGPGGRRPRSRRSSAWSFVSWRRPPARVTPRRRRCWKPCRPPRLLHRLPDASGRRRRRGQSARGGVAPIRAQRAAREHGSGGDRAAAGGPDVAGGQERCPRGRASGGTPSSSEPLAAARRGLRWR
jgi:hypothetical protein